MTIAQVLAQDGKIVLQNTLKVIEKRKHAFRAQ
mgnify:CR=1 FL=1